MKSFGLVQWVIIIILSLLTALEPLSIDLYLPGFIMISEAFSTSVSSVQISLSTFLAGFAVGQLIWGPVSDKLGRKKPILFSLLIFTLASIACIYVKTIEQLWVVRFLQAIGGCAGVVISRAIVTDYFDKSKTLKIFALLGLIMGIAPILGPGIGNFILHFSSWKGLFGSMAGLGILLFILTLFFLPETFKPESSLSDTSGKKQGVLKNYMEVMKNKKFVIYALIAGISNGVLMIYVANGPFIIMEKGGFSGDAFSIIFAINAFGLMSGSYLTSIFQKYCPTGKIVKLALLFMLAINIILLISMNTGIIFTLVTLFFYIFPIGILFPATTELAITPFAGTNKSGTASALFGSIQLAVAFICTIFSGLISNGTLISVGIGFLFCSIISSCILFIRLDPKKEYNRSSAR